MSVVYVNFDDVRLAGVRHFGVFVNTVFELAKPHSGIIYFSYTPLWRLLKAEKLIYLVYFGVFVSVWWGKSFRILVFILMLAFGLAAMTTGVVLYLWPKGPRAGRIEVFGYTKDFWIDAHTILAMTSVVLIIVHLVLNWRAVKFYFDNVLKG